MKKETIIRFKTKERQMLKWLHKKFTVFELSAKFHVQSITIERWLAGDNIPPYSTRIMIARMYEEDKK